MYIKTLKECQREVAIKHKIGTSLVTGHRAGYFNEAAEIYADQYKKLLEEDKFPKIKTLLEDK